MGSAYGCLARMRLARSTSISMYQNRMRGGLGTSRVARWRKVFSLRTSISEFSLTGTDLQSYSPMHQLTLFLCAATLTIGCGSRRSHDPAVKDSAAPTAAKTDTVPTINRHVEDVKRAVPEFSWSRVGPGQYSGELTTQDGTQCLATVLTTSDGSIKRVELDTRGTEAGAQKALERYGPEFISSLSSARDSSITKHRPGDAWDHEELQIGWIWISGAGPDDRAYRNYYRAEAIGALVKPQGEVFSSHKSSETV